MSDQQLRELERVARRDGWKGWDAQEALEMARIRAGARDPRVDPRAGDYLAGKTVREVLAVWPRELAASIGAFTLPQEFGNPDVNIHELPKGTLVYLAKYRLAAPGGDPEDFEVRFLAQRPLGQLRPTWFLTYSFRRGPLELEPGPGWELPVEWVTWRANHREEEHTTGLAQWRRWAREARVRRAVVPPLPGCDHRHGLIPCPTCGRSV